MFIIIHLSKYKCKDLNTRILILEEACPATNYVTAMFHPTIGQCAHQSLSNTSTPKLCMIPTRNKGTLAISQIAKDITRIQPSKHRWVYQATKELERLTAKLVSSNTELWTPAPDWAWILKHLHTQHREEFPSLLHSPSGYAFHSTLGIDM